MDRLKAPIIFLLVVATLFFINAVWSKQFASSKTDQTVSDLSAYAVDDPAPGLTARDSDDKDQDIINSLTKPTLISFWDITCSECKAGLRTFQDFQVTHPDFAIILIGHAMTVKDGKDFLQTNPVQLNSYFDPSGQALLTWQGTMPSSYYVVDGRIKYFFPGRISEQHLNLLLTSN